MRNQALPDTSQLHYEQQAWFAIWCFALLIGLPLAVGIGSPLILVFPGSALALALFLYYRAPRLYVGYVLWMFFLCNLIRRLIDYRAGYPTPGPWGFTAFVVASVSLITAFRCLPVAHRKGGIPFVFAMSAIGYAFCVGFYQNPLNALVNETLNWLCPVAFGFHLFQQWRDYPNIKKVFSKAFLWGVLLMGGYGVIQYIFAPPWEQFFLNYAGGSFGSPEPFGVRVFSSLGSPQAFAAVMLTGLIIIFCNTTNPISYVASGFGYISFILTMARAVWLSAAISIPLFLLSLKPSYQIRMLIVVIVIFTIVATTLLSWEPVYEKFYERFESFLNLESDTSFNARAEGYQVLWGVSVVQFLGQGIGFSIKKFGVSLGENDGSFFPLIFTFGWMGLTFYLGGFLMLLIKLFQIPDARSDVFIGACRMVVLCLIVQAGFNSVFSGDVGAMMWGFLAVALAGHKYYAAQRQVTSSEQLYLQAK